MLLRIKICTIVHMIVCIVYYSMLYCIHCHKLVDVLIQRLPLNDLSSQDKRGILTLWYRHRRLIDAYDNIYARYLSRDKVHLPASTTSNSFSNDDLVSQFIEAMPVFTPNILHLDGINGSWSSGESRSTY